MNVASGLYNIEGKTWVDQHVFFEFGRRYTVRAPTGNHALVKGTTPDGRRNMFVWDFGVTSGGASYNLISNHKPFGSVAWRVYTIPFATRVIGTWMHSHSPFASEMFIIKGDVQQMLPSALVLRCKYRRQCVSEGIWGNGTERNI